MKQETTSCNTLANGRDGTAIERTHAGQYAGSQPHKKTNTGRIIEFVVPGQPIGKGRPRATTIGGAARLYTPSKTRDYEGLIGLHGALAMAGMPPLAGALAVVLDIRLQVPASWSKAKRADALAGRLLPTGKPDKDNVIKAIYDALNGVCWVDDSQVCEGVQRKRYAAEPGVLVEIEEIA